ncbi:MAG: trypsin-like peptidase domain-containing protein [Verrucomicrobiaceae bacterium]|nr:trypsin-like peptidase domain-containing protein [Verrucomicrobiaceae bacterium]
MDRGKNALDGFVKYEPENEDWKLVLADGTPVPLSNKKESFSNLLKNPAYVAALNGGNEDVAGYLGVYIPPKSSTPQKHLVGEIGLPSCNQWKVDYDRQIDAKYKEALLPVDQAVEKFQEAWNELQAGVTPGKAGHFVKAYAALKDEIGTVYGAVEDVSVKTHLAKLRRNAQDDAAAQIVPLAGDAVIAGEIDRAGSDGMVLKGMAGRNDNYPADSHLMIHTITRSCCAIFWKGASNASKPFGSGVLIAPDLVLTCKHVVDKNQYPTDNPPLARPKDLEVHFDYKEAWDADKFKMSGVAQPVVCKVLDIPFWGKKIDEDTGALDYAILRIEWKDADISSGAARRRPLALLNQPSLMEKPIFLVGHPRGTHQTVHENSWLMLPYRMGRDEIGKLESFIASNLLPEVASKQQASEKARAFVKAFYRPRKLEDVDWIEYASQPKEGRLVYAYGAECDTFKGDSGAPAITRDLGQVCGILQEGVRDSNPDGSDYFYKTSTQEHELILPATAIIEQVGESVLKGQNVQIE